MKKLVLPLLVLTTLALGGCKLFPSRSSGGGDSGEDDDRITVKFYLDYNQLAVDNIYYQYKVENHKKLNAPDVPSKDQAPLPEFPVFKGWSTKQLIDDEKDLWDFSKDVMEVQDGVDQFRLYGFWAAEGE